MAVGTEDELVLHLGATSWAHLGLFNRLKQGFPFFFRQSAGAQHGRHFQLADRLAAMLLGDLPLRTLLEGPAIPQHLAGIGLQLGRAWVLAVATFQLLSVWL